MMLRPNDDGLLDIVFGDDGDVVMETGFETAILASLLLNRRANAEDILPYGYQGKSGALCDDRQGWPGDILDSKGRLVGSRLWLLDQELATNETRARAIEYVKECLRWSIDDGYVSHIEFDPEWAKHDRLNLGISVFLTNGNVLSLRVNYETGGIYVV